MEKKPLFFKVVQTNKKEVWVNPKTISTIRSSLTTLSLKMVTNEIIEFNYYDEANKPLLNYMQLWAPPPKELLQ